MARDFLLPRGLGKDNMNVTAGFWRDVGLGMGPFAVFCLPAFIPFGYGHVVAMVAALFAGAFIFAGGWAKDRDPFLFDVLPMLGFLTFSVIIV